MKLFLIEAYGGPAHTNGHVERLTVRAETLAEAISLARQSPQGRAYRYFDLVEESAELEGDEPAVLDLNEGSAPER